jgi:hypothetical protein
MATMEGSDMATMEELETDGLGARWHRVHVDPISMVAMLAPWQMARDAVRDAIDRGELESDDESTMLHTIHDRIVTEATRLARASHTWWTDPHGDESPIAPAPDPYTRVQSSTVKRRSNSGQSYDQVIAHGRGYVVGSLDPAGPNRDAAMSTDRIRHALATAPRTVNGRDAIAIARLTDAIYPDLPRLIGADTVSFEEFGSWDPVLARSPRRGHGTRYRLPTVRRRNGETGAAHELIAPSASPDHVWIGHRHVLRSVTVRDHRAANRVRPIAETVDVTPRGDESPRIAETVEYLASTCAPGYRAIVRNGDVAFTFSRGNGKAERYHVTGKGWRVNARTPRGIARAVAAHV